MENQPQYSTESDEPADVAVPPIPPNAQTVINIACAVRDRIDGSSLYHDDFDLVFKAAVQMAFAT